MKKSKPVGLILSGRLADSTLARFPALSRDAGPVAAASRRLASRFSNALRGGYPITDWAELASARMIWLQVPASELGQTLQSLVEAVPCWKGRIAVLLDAHYDSTALEPLSRCGAAVSSLTHAPLLDSDIALVEGDLAALRQLRPLLRRARLRTVQMKPGAKVHLSAGLSIATTLTGPVTDASMRALRAAGLDQAIAKRIVGKLMETEVRNFQAHGRKAWVSPAAEIRRDLTMRHLVAVGAEDAAHGRFVEQAFQAALEWYGDSLDAESKATEA